MVCGHSGLSPGGHTDTDQISGAHRPPLASPLSIASFGVCKCAACKGHSLPVLHESGPKFLGTGVALDSEFFVRVVVFKQ